MNLSNNKVSRLFQFFACFCLVHLSQGQSIDLGIQFTGAQPTQVPVGSVFAITGQVFVEANATGVTAGQTVVATAEFKDPDGLLIGSHTETWNGFPNGPSTLDNDPTGVRQVLFTIPWSQSQKWQALDGNKSQWSVTLRLDGVTGEVSLATNQQTHFFEVIIPDLEVRDSLVVSATDLTTGNLSNVFLPNSEVTVQGAVENIGGVTTQEGIFFPLVARLLNANGTVMDQEMLVLPNNGNTRLLAGDVINFTIPNLHIPNNAAGTYNVEVIVDPTDLPTGQHLVFETDDTTNNRKQATFSINAVDQTLSIDPDSFVGDTGTFRGLDPVRLSFAVRNTSTVAVATGDNFTAQVLLSENDSSSTDDFILREFDLSGDALGANLLPNETITFDWIQQLPDNFEGDYYLLVNITGSGDFALENTPVITLISENKGVTELVEPNNNVSTERPHASSDGRIIVYEETDNQGIQQIYLVDTILDSLPLLISHSYLNSFDSGNGDSLRPRVSADGSTVVFHSKASNLIAGDQNGHGDVFLYKTFTQQLLRAQNFDSGEEPNNNSYYPDVNFDGSAVVFESDATNIQANQLTNSGRQIFLWDLNARGNGLIRAITNGNGESRSAGIDQTGNLIVFSSFASNLLNVTDNNAQEDVFLFKVDENKTYLASLSSFGTPTTGGASGSPAVSGDGSTIVFASTADNMVSGKGISSIQLISGGAGYFGNPTAVVSDLKGPGTGALLSLVNAVDVYGQIIESAIEIISNGSGYVSPIVTIIPDPTQPSPTETAQVRVRLSHEKGEIYLIKTADVLTYPASTDYSKRISESASGIGGDMESREPAISYDGQLIAFTTKSSNLLDQNITRQDGQVFYNQVGKIASARAILVGGIGEIEIQNPGIGYNAGFLKIEDFSGNGSGAIASYQVDSANGRIISITVVNPGKNYQLDTTEVTVGNPNGGSGFQAGTIRFLPVFGFGNNRTGGGRIHRIEMIENGLGYQLPQNGNSISSIISVDGDGTDLDSNGKPDAKLNADRVHLGTNGEVYLEQRFDIEFLSTTSLANTTLTFSDYTKSINITFGNSASQLQVNTTNKNASTIRDEVIAMIQTQWSSPSAISNGPLIDSNSSGGSTFTFKGLSAGVATNSPSSVRVSSQSNMIFSGNGYTRATPVIAPPSVIYGYSEVLSGTTTVSTLGGRRIFDVQIDTFSDDIYLYDQNAFNNQRISKSTFGFPVNYLPSATSSMPSNRFPSISADGRHVLFSSDAQGQGGLAFGNSNQIPTDNNTVRDVLHHDRKVFAPSTAFANVDLLYPTTSVAHSFGSNSPIPVIVQVDHNESAVSFVRVLVNGTPIAFMTEFGGGTPYGGGFSSYDSKRYTTTLNNSPFSALSNSGDHTIQAIAYNDNFRVVGSSQIATISVKPYSGSLSPDITLLEPVSDSLTSTSQIPLYAEGSDPDGRFVGVQFYVNGTPFGSEMLRPEIFSSESLYTTLWSPGKEGFYSIFAVVRDNSGNYFSSAVENISSTTGSVPTIAEFSRPVFNQIDLNSSHINVETNGSISSVILPNIQSEYHAVPRIDISGTGSGAVIRPIIQFSDPASPGYRTIAGLDIVNPGLGYDSISTKISIIPVVQTIKLGDPAVVATTYDLNASGDIQATNFYMPVRFDNSLMKGSGYVTAPRFSPGSRFIPSRLVLETPAPGESTSSVEPFELVRIPAPPIYDRGVVFGGFNHSPIFLEVNASLIPENTVNISFVVNGLVDEVVSSPPYVHDYVADDPGDYSIVALLRDGNGNISSSSAMIVSASEIIGTAPVAFFEGAQDETLQVGSNYTLTASASSANGIAKVEFYLDNEYIGEGKQQNNTNYYSYDIELKDLSEGPHEFSLVAYDTTGNQVGTFPNLLTNIEPKLNKRFRIKASLNQHLPTIELLAPFTADLPSGSMATYNKGDLVTLLIEANSSSFSEVSQIKLLNNGVYVSFFGPDGLTTTLNHNRSSASHQQGFYELNFEVNSTGLQTLVPVVIDSFGNQRLATQSVTITAKKNFGSSPPIMRLVSPYKASLGTIWLDAANNEDAVEEINYMKVGSTIPLAAIASDIDKDFKSLEFFVNGKAISSPMILEEVMFPDEFPYSMVWEAKSKGTYHFYARGIDYAGNVSFSNVSSVEVLDAVDLPPLKPEFIANFVLAEANASLVGDSVSAINLSNVGYGFASAPEVVINNFGAGGTGATATAEFDFLSKKLTGIKMTNGGSGYTSPPEILILGGLPTVVSTGKSAQATAFTNAGNSIAFIRVDDPGYGYNSTPEVSISHPTGDGAVAEAIMGPSPVFGLEVRGVALVDGGQNYSPQNQIVVSFLGGQAFETESFKVNTSDPDGQVTKVEFLSLGGGLFRKFSDRSLPPYKGEWDAPLAGKYHLYSLAHDNRNNITSSRLLLENVVNPTAPQVQFTPYDRAQVSAVIDGGVITELKLEHNGSYYNSTPTLIIEGDGQGAFATGSVDLLTGQLTGVNLLNGGSGYTYAKVRVFAGLEKQNVDPQIVLGETIMVGISAADFDGDVVKLMLIENGDKTAPKLAVDDIIDQNFEPGSFQYDGAEPYFSVYFTPIALGGLELQIAAQDDDGFITYSNPLSFQVVNGEVPLVSMVTPMNGSRLSVGSEQIAPITLVGQASDPDWGFNNNVDELSRITGMMFFANNRFIGYGTKVDGTDLYYVEWNATVTGEYEVVVAAVDSQVGTPYLDSPEDLPNVISNRGNTAISKPIKIEIERKFDSRLPVITMESNLTNTVINTTSTSTIRLEASASDPDGSLEGVQFYVNRVQQYAWSGILDFNGSVPMDGQTLTIDDATGKNAVTFEFDDNNSLSEDGNYSVTGAFGNKLNDLTISGSFTGLSISEYIIEIDGVGSPNTFRWSKDGGITYTDEKVAIKDLNQTIENGLSAHFTSITGHALGDRWNILGIPQNIVVPIKNNDHPQVNSWRTRDALQEAIIAQEERGTLSIFINTEASNDQLVLYHNMDQLLMGTVNITGSSLSVTGVGGSILFNDNDFDSNNIADNFVRRDHSYGLPFYPFGMTWTPGMPGVYIAYGVAVDSVSNNRVMSHPKIITVTTGTGRVPQIELSPVTSPIIYNGTASIINLDATAYDPDGKIIEVSFFGNGRLLNRDSTVPYEATMDYNASGHYEVYAVVSDDDGNDITSTVQRIVVNSANETQEDAITILVSPPSSFLGGFSTITGNFKSPSVLYDPNIRIEGYVNGMFAGSATILPYTPPAPGQIDPGYSFEFQFPARKVGLSEIELVVINGAETRSMNSTFEVEHSPITDNVKFIESVYETMFQRPPALFELNEWIYPLEDGSMTKAQLFDELRCRKEFRKAVNIMLSHKTLWGDWLCLDKILIEQEVDENVNGTPGGGADDYGNDEQNAQLVTMNQVVRGQIELPEDVDYFYIESLNPSSDGELTISIDAGSPGVTVSGTGVDTDPMSFNASGRIIPLLRGYNIVETPIVAGGGFWTGLSGQQFQSVVDLSVSNVMDRWYFSVRGNTVRTGYYTLRLSNPTVGGGGGMVLVPGNLDSPVMDFLISSYLNNQVMLFSYKNQYGEIGRHNPEEFFRRIFVNKYEQTPSPIQIARGADLVQSEGSNQIGFLEDFALDNSVITVGPYNYTSELSIPNVPLDFAAFGETALVYCSLIGHAPTELEVAKLTLTPNYEVRCLSERAKMIMELPKYTARYGLSLPEVDFVGVENGRRYVTGLDHTILVEAVTLGNDRLSGTIDDNGSVRELDMFLNGDLNSTRSTLNINGYYEFTLPATLPSGEYRMEVVAEDSNGLQSRAERSIALVGETDPVITLDSPAQGTILQKGVETKFSYSTEGQNVTAYLEVDGAIRWKNHIAFAGTRLPTDNSTISIDDGTGRMPVIFEFDSDGLASDGNTTVGPSVPMDVSGSTILTSSGTYLGIEEREYLLEIDTTGSSNTFRWSTNGGANFNNSLVPIKANQPISLSSGVIVTFSSSTDAELGDRWQIKAYPKNEMVNVHRFGTFAERINETKHNLIRTINRVRNEGNLSIKADNSNAGMGLYQGSDPIQSLDGKTIILRHDGSYPIKKPVLINLQGDTSLVIEDCLPLSTSGPGLSGLLGLKLGECFDLCRPVIEVRVCAFNSTGHAGYSDPYVFTVTDPNRLSVELLEPLGRLAILRIVEVTNGAITKVKVVDGGSGYSNETSTLTILSENGSGADLQVVLGSKGEIRDIIIPSGSGGSNYLKSDMILVSSPKQYRVGETISLMAKVNDPRGELSSVAFFANGINIVSNDVNMSNLNGSVNRITEKIWQGEFTLEDENIHFISARALYGDSEFVDGESRDNGPSCPPIYCGTSCEEDLWCGEGFWGWRRSWIQQHCLPPSYLCPPWFWGNLDYWPWPPPWMNMPAPSGALPILSYSIKPTDSAAAKIASPLDPVEIPLSLPKDEDVSPGDSVPLSRDWLSKYSMFLKEKSVIKFSDGINETSLYTVSKIRMDSVETTENFSRVDLEIINEAKNLMLIVTRQVYVGSSINFTVPIDNQSQISSVQFFINGEAQNIITSAPWSFLLLVDKIGVNKIQSVVSYADVESQVLDMEFDAKAAIGDIPEGQIFPSIPSQNILFSKGSELLARANFVDQDGNGKTVETVEFYLNGTLLASQNQPPFFVRFKPDTTQLVNIANPPYPWELTAVGIDSDGNIITEFIRGNLDGFPLISLPTGANLNISITGQKNNGQVIDGSPCTVDVVIQGQATTLNLIYWRTETAPPTGVPIPNPFRVKLYANGIFAAESLTEDLVPILDSGNNVLQLSYRIPYSPSFINQAKADGSLTLTGALEYQSPPPVVTNSVLTNDLFINVKPPTPWVDYESSLLTIRNDLLGTNNPISSEELQQGLSAVNNGAFFDWVADLSNKSAFINRLDLMAAYHIINGKFFDNHSLFNKNIQNYIISWNNNMMPVGSIDWYKGFINESFKDVFYQNSFGDVPYLIGDFTKRNLFPYSDNRLKLIEQFMTNKWGVAPTYSQKLQGSKKLLSFWLNFQPNYWEGLGRDDDIRDTPPRRDTFLPNLYEAGELAVELVWQLASEKNGLGGLPWIFNTTNLRDSRYTAATALALLLQGNWDFNQGEINKLSGYSKKDIFKYIVQDSRYQSRYFLIWKFAADVEGSPYWKIVDWFGYFTDKNFPWIYHLKLGWLYHGSNTTSSMWLYSPSIEGWMWTNNQDFPWLYLPKLQKWVFLNLEDVTGQIPAYIAPPDDLTPGKWVQFSDL